MSPDHVWQVREVAHIPAPSDYDIDVTDGVWGTVHTCSGCGLRVFASESLAPDQVHGIPECEPFEAAIPDPAEWQEQDPTEMREPQQRTRDAIVRRRLAAEGRALAAAELASLAIGQAGGQPAEVDVAISQVCVHAARVLSVSAFDVNWCEPRWRRMLAVALLLAEWRAEDEAAKGWADPRPNEMLKRLRELRKRAEESILPAEVMES